VLSRSAVASNGPVSTSSTESRPKDFGGQLIDAHATPDGLDGQLICEQIGEPDDGGHRVNLDRWIIEGHVRDGASTRSRGGVGHPTIVARFAYETGEWAVMTTIGPH